MSSPDYEDSGPPSDRERADQWRRTLYQKLEAVHAAINEVKVCLYVLIGLAVVALWRHW